MITHEGKSLIAAIFLKALQDIQYSKATKKNRESAIRFFQSDWALELIEIFGVEQEYYLDWVRRILKNDNQKTLSRKNKLQ